MLWICEIPCLQMRMTRLNIAWYIRQSTCSRFLMLAFFNVGINMRTRAFFVNFDIMCWNSGMNQGPLDKGKLIISVPAHWNFSILLSAMHVEPQLCAICKTSVDTGIPSSTPTAKGSSSTNLVSIARNESIRTIPREVVHQECHHKIL